ncbi:MAG: hypothetical protein VXW32_11510 [Myxococcota bacterium]|nr:hypothetical protein [Myxococcota bacterium]
MIFKLRRAHWEWAFYLLLALVAVSKALRPGHVVGDGVDMYGSIWFFWYAAESLESLSNPSWTSLFFYPLGKDIFAHTGNNLLDAYLAAPFQWLFGFTGWTRWWVMLVLVGNALTFRVLAKHLFDSPNAVFATTVAWQLNPYVLFELTCGRYTQALLWFVPIALYAFLKMQGDPRWRWPVLAGVMTGLQAWTYWFMGFFMGLAFVWLFLWGLRRSERRLGFVLRSAAAAAAAIAVVLPGILAMLRAASDNAVPGLADGAVKDLFSLPPGLDNNVGQALHGYDFFGYLGPPMLTYWTWGIPVLIWLALGPGRARWLPVLTLVLLFSLGPSANLPWGDTQQVMPHYMAAYHYVPFFDRLWFPYRMLSVAMVVAALAFGFLVVQVERRFPSWKARVPVGVVVFAALTGLEQSRFGIFPLVSRDLSTPEVFDWIGSQEGEGAQAIITVPFGPGQPNIVWQARHERPLFGGMGENASLLWPEGFRRRTRNSFYQALMRSIRDPEVPIPERPYVPVQRTMMEREGFRWVILDRSLLAQEFVKKLGRPQQADIDQHTQLVVENLSSIVGHPVVAAEDRWVVWDLTGEADTPVGLEPTAERLRRVTWPEVDAPLYDQKLSAAGRVLRGGPPGTHPDDVPAATGKKRIRRPRRKAQ